MPDNMLFVRIVEVPTQNWIVTLQIAFGFWNAAIAIHGELYRQYERDSELQCGVKGGPHEMLQHNSSQRYIILETFGILENELSSLTIL